jgi:hypothetical protein
MTESLHPAASDALPSFITPPGETDVLMVVMAVILVLAVLMFGIIYFRLHSLPERMAHRSHKLQFEIVAVLGLISLFTHMHIFWIAGLLLALIELPDFGTPLSRIAGSVEKIAGTPPGEGTAGPHASSVAEANEGTGVAPKTYEISQADKVATLPTTTRQPKRS